MIILPDKTDIGRRLDIFVAEEGGVTRSFAAKLIESKNVLVNGKSSNKKYTLRENDVVELDIPEPVEYEVAAEDIPLDIVYEDGSVIVINKPSGMVVHPAAGNYTGTLVNALLYHCKDSLSGINGVVRPGIVHRIDKDTSGLLVVAKNDASHLFLAEQLKTHDVSRVYHAIVIGNIKEDTGTVDAPIGRNPHDRKKMAVIRGEGTARDAVTHFRVLERYGRYTYIELELETGRTHQIRVHMASIGHPLVGDEVYGGGGTDFEKKNAKLLCGQCLHAKRLSFTHPDTREQVSFECPLPDYFETVLDKFRNMN